MSKLEILRRVERVASDPEQMEKMRILEEVLEGLIVYGGRRGEAPEILEAKRQELTETKRIISMARQVRQAKRN